MILHINKLICKFIQINFSYKILQYPGQVLILGFLNLRCPVSIFISLFEAEFMFCWVFSYHSELSFSLPPSKALRVWEIVGLVMPPGGWSHAAAWSSCSEDLVLPSSKISPSSLSSKDLWKT